MNFLKYQNFLNINRSDKDQSTSVQQPQTTGTGSETFYASPKTYSRCSDELWINNWIKQNNIIPSQTKTKYTRSFQPIQINQAKKALRQCLGILNKLNEGQEQLQQNVNTMSSNEWRQKTVEIGFLKDEFTKIIGKFDNVESITYLKRLILKRQKRRSNLKMKKKLKGQVQKEAENNKQKIHQEIDQWLASMKEEAEKVKMEENMKKDADCVLAEVTKKKSDARKQISLISALVKLRTVREQMANQRGEKLSLEDSSVFKDSTEKLVKMWESSLKTYSTEEQGLRLMLEKTASEDYRAAKTAKERKLLNEWHTVLFGPKHIAPVDNPTYWALTSAERDVETFIAIRKSWDTFLVEPENEQGSKIPIGWVLPDENSLESWTKYLSY